MEKELMMLNCQIGLNHLKISWKRIEQLLKVIMCQITFIYGLIWSLVANKDQLMTLTYSIH